MKEDLLKIINHYGVMSQLKHFQSEVFELNEAIIRFEEAKKNYFEGYGLQQHNLEKHIAEEIADVLVMLKQFQYYYGIEDKNIDKNIEEIMKYKVERQLERINKGE